MKFLIQYRAELKDEAFDAESTNWWDALTEALDFQIKTGFAIVAIYRNDGDFER